jgi:hypothetical protein
MSTWQLIELAGIDAMRSNPNLAADIGSALAELGPMVETVCAVMEPHATADAAFARGVQDGWIAAYLEAA